MYDLIQIGKELRKRRRKLKIRLEKRRRYLCEDGKLVKNYVSSIRKFDKYGRLIHSCGFDEKGTVISKAIWKYFQDGKMSEIEYFRKRKMWKIISQSKNRKEYATMICYWKNRKIKTTSRSIKKYDCNGNLLEEIRLRKIKGKKVVEQYVTEYIKKPEAKQKTKETYV